jgi:hypothetical protein
MDEKNTTAVSCLWRKIEKRIEELIGQCKDIPPEEIMRLLLTDHENAVHDSEKNLQALFKKYRKKINGEQQGL